MSVPTSIDAVVKGVPPARSAFYWHLTETVDENLRVLEYQFAKYRQMLPEGCKFDEAAIMVPSYYHLGKLASALEKAGWAQFNNAKDLVFTNPFSTRYFVEYVFFRHPEKEYRLEVMMMAEGEEDGQPGFSPLHAALWQNGERPAHAGHTMFPVPHLSFKPVRIVLPESRGLQKETAGRAYGRSINHLRDQGFIHAQSCQSTYGMFGYYLHQDSIYPLYVKPRINVRDEVMHSMCTVDSNDGCM